jgi:hypothetical protein
MKTQQILNIKYLREHYEYHSSGRLIIKKATSRGRAVGEFVVGWIKNGSHKYWQMMVRKKKARTHRVIFAIVHGYIPKYIDHIDGNTLNNKIENLRECTQSENSTNSKIRTDNSTGIKGLGFHKSTNRWRGRIKKEGKLHYLQSVNKGKVISWLKKTRLKLHGEYAHD